MQPMDSGQPCKENGPKQMYYFTTNQERCLLFHYKGCGGNSNRFKSQDNCIDACQVAYYRNKHKMEDSATKAPKHNKTGADCQGPADPGPCRALITEWFFDTETSSCQPFSYGGCYGNSNRFETKSLCEEVCLQKKSS